MTISMYSASVPVFRQILGGLRKVMQQGAKTANQMKVEDAVFLDARLFPDFFPLARQCVVATDFARSCCARLAGRAVPTIDGRTDSFEGIDARITATLDYLAGFTPSEIDLSESRAIAYNIGTIEKRYVGETYLLHAVMPQFVFHVSAAYAILRHNGVVIGKKDFLGVVPGVIG